MQFIPNRILLILSVLIICSTPVLAASDAFLFRVEEGLTLPGVSEELRLAGKADVSGDGQEEWVFIAADTVKLYHLNRLGGFVLWQEYSFPATISTLHLGDLDGDAVSEVIVGYDGIGILDVIGWSDGKWWKSYSRVYLWSEILNLDLLSLGSFPFNPILAITADGGLHILRWNGVNPELQWSSTKLSNKRIAYAGSGDFDGDKNSDFALVINDSELRVYSPEKAQLQPIWTNFPWGGVAGAEILDIDGDGLEEIVTVSPVGLLYSFEFRNQTYQQKWRYEDIPSTPKGLKVYRLPESKRLALISHVRGDLVIWPLNNSGVPQYRSVLSMENKNWALSKDNAGSIGANSKGQLLQLSEYPSDEIKLHFQTRGIDFSDIDGLVHQGQIWLPLREMAPLFGLRTDWNDLSKLLYLSKTGVFMIFDPADQTIWINGLQYKTTGLRNINGTFVLSLPFAEEFFNFQTHWLGSNAYLFPNQ